MGTHYHIVLRPTLGQVGDGMRVVNGAHSRAFNGRHGRRGALFERRYTATEIRSEEHLVSTVQYVELNAVAASIVDDPRDWPWSTHEGCALRTLFEPCLLDLTRLAARGGRERPRYATSRSFCESARARSFFRPWFSICRIRSRVTWNARPTSSSVHGCSPFRP